jgi:hypothetical protein
MKLRLGKIYASIGAVAAFAAALDSDAPDAYLAQHESGDWGEVDDQDRKANDYAAEHDERVLSAYTLRTGEKIWVITEADRSTTTILLASEY